MTDCPTCEYHKQRAQIWRDEVYKLTGHPLPRKEKSMTQDEMIAKLTEMLEIQQKLHETAIDMLKPAIEAEREACAKIVDEWFHSLASEPEMEKIAEQIRARGENK